MEPVLLTLEPDGETYPENPHEAWRSVMSLRYGALVFGKKNYSVKRGESFLIHPDKPQFLR
jgi:hypothetical protein